MVIFMLNDANKFKQAILDKDTKTIADLILEHGIDIFVAKGSDGNSGFYNAWCYSGDGVTLAALHALSTAFFAHPVTTEAESAKLAIVAEAHSEGYYGSIQALTNGSIPISPDSGTYDWKKHVPDALESVARQLKTAILENNVEEATTLLTQHGATLLRVDMVTMIGDTPLPEATALWVIINDSIKSGHLEMVSLIENALKTGTESDKLLAAVIDKFVIQPSHTTDVAQDTTTTSEATQHASELHTDEPTNTTDTGE